MSNALAGLGRRMAKGAAWTIGTHVGVKLIGLVSTIILARLLVPEDFGLVAIAMLLVGALEATSEFGFRTVLIYNQEAGRPEYDTVWTLSVLRGAVLALLMMIAAAPIAGFFDEPRIEAIIYVFVALAMIEGFANIGTVDFHKELHFHKQFRLDLSAKLAGFAVTIPLAFIWRDYWALVVGMAVGRVVKTGLSYVMHPYRPRLSLVAWRPIMNYSKWLIGKNILMFIRNKFDVVVLGKVIGPASLGLYTVAHEISNLVTSQLMAPIRQALFPGYAKMAHDRDALRRSVVDSFALILLIAIPIVLGIGLVADPFVRVALGPNWTEAIPLLQILAIYGLATTGVANTGPIYLALGYPNVIFYVMLGSVAILVPSLIWAANHVGTVGVAIAVAATAILTSCVHLAIVTRILELPAVRLLNAVWRTLASAGLMAAVVILVQTFMAVDAAAPVYQHGGVLAASVVAGAASYIGLHLGLWWKAGYPAGAEKHIFNLLQERLWKRNITPSRV